VDILGWSGSLLLVLLASYPLLEVMAYLPRTVLGLGMFLDAQGVSFELARRMEHSEYVYKNVYDIVRNEEMQQ
jgi:hypothetical protein